MRTLASGADLLFNGLLKKARAEAELEKDLSD